jgi:hypothetical protein
MDIKHFEGDFRIIFNGKWANTFFHYEIEGSKVPLLARFSFKTKNPPGLRPICNQHEN